MGKNKERKPGKDINTSQDAGGLDISGLMASLNSGGASMREQKDYSSYKPSHDRNRKNNKDGQDGYNKGTKGKDGNRQEGYNQSRRCQGGYRQSGYNQGRGGKKNGIVLDAEYVHAPFNFIPQWKIVQKIRPEDFKPHDEMDDMLYSGQIAYTIEALTPVFIGNGKKKENSDFVKNARGEYIIPGSSIRGLIRNNAQILGFADISEDVDDYSLMFRKVGGTSRDDLNKQYKELLGDKPVALPGGGSISVLTKVKAGYICKSGNRYLIYGSAVDEINPTFEDMNYYIIGEKKILEKYRDYVNGGKKGVFDYDALIFGKDNKLAHRPRWADFQTRTRQIDPFTKIEKRNKKDEIIIQYKGDKNKYYLPSFFPVSYELSGDRYVTKVRAPGKCSRQGYALLSGPMNDKKAVYIIPEIDWNKEIYMLDPEGGTYAEDLQSFRIDYMKREKTLALRDYPYPDDSIINKYKAFFNLPSEEGEIKPVFYFYNGGHIYFGFTPHLRLYFNHTIHDGLIHKDAKGYDIVKSIFGYARKKDSRKGKVYFSDVAAQNNPVRGAIREVVLQEPKPTNYYTYLTHEKGQVSNYNDDDYKLSGVKQYWLHEQIMTSTEAVQNTKIQTSMRPLPANTFFEGKVRFENLTEKELGLLLWSMRLESNSCMNIGQGKPYGYGVIKLQIIENETKLVKQEEAYDLSKGLIISPFKELDVNRFIEKYKEKAAELYGKGKAEEVMGIPSVRAFFRMKDFEHMLPDSKLEYMTMDEFKEQKRENAVLPTVDELDAQLKMKKS